MKVSEIIRELREDYLDDEATPHLWGSGKLRRFLSRAQEEACMRQRILVDNSTAAICEVPLVDGQAEYVLDPRIVLVENIRIGEVTLTKRSRAELDRKDPYWRDRVDGDIDTYYQNDLTVRVIPTPRAADDGETMYLRVWRMPLVSFTADTDVPEIPSQYHRDLMWFAIGTAFSLPDEDTQDTNRADFYFKKFDSVFGPPLRADVLAHKRRETGVTYFGQGHAYHGRKTPSMSPARAFDFED